MNCWYEKKYPAEGTSGVTFDGMDFQMLQIEADINYKFKAGGEEAAFKPFGIAGVGMTNVKISEATIKGDGETVTLPFL